MPHTPGPWRVHILNRLHFHVATVRVMSPRVRAILTGLGLFLLAWGIVLLSNAPEGEPLDSGRLLP